MIDDSELRGPAVKRAPFTLQGLRRRIGQARVEPVIAEAGGDIRVPFGPVVQVLPCQPGELSVRGPEGSQLP